MKYLGEKTMPPDESSRPETGRIEKNKNVGGPGLRGMEKARGQTLFWSFAGAAAHADRRGWGAARSAPRQRRDRSRRVLGELRDPGAF